MATENYKSVQEFVSEFDAGNLDGNLTAELLRLTDEQRDELIRVLLERDREQTR